jgi:phospholipase/carboxylesterase
MTTLLVAANGACAPAGVDGLAPRAGDRTFAVEGDTRDMSSAPAAHARGRILARPRVVDPAPADGDAGVQRLGLDSRRDAYLRVPRGQREGRRLPLVVMLHGAGGSGRGALSLVQGGGFEEALVLAPESRGRTWDALVAALGPDVAFIDDALEHVFARYPVDPERIVIAGFSDGASYALTLGIANGTLFRRIVAFSPGFASPPSTEGVARIWISHGTEDPVLPVQSCSRRIVPRLRRAGFDVTYREFPGEHEMPDQIVFEAWSWVRQR